VEILKIRDLSRKTQDIAILLPPRQIFAPESLPSLETKNDKNFSMMRLKAE
jgi:hypothetical protein